MKTAPPATTTNNDATSNQATPCEEKLFIDSLEVLVGVAVGRNGVEVDEIWVAVAGGVLVGTAEAVADEVGVGVGSMTYLKTAPSNPLLMLSPPAKSQPS
jgi:hypothetical protein